MSAASEFMAENVYGYPRSGCSAGRVVFGVKRCDDT